MQKTIALIFIIAIILLISGCGQADFAKVKVKSSSSEFSINEEYPMPGDVRYLVLSMDIENLTDSVLYIESSSPADEEGEKHLWFVLKDQDGNEYKATYYSEIESDIFPMSVSPRTTTTGEMAFIVPNLELQEVILEVTQNVVGERGSKVIYTQEIPL